MFVNAETAQAVGIGELSQSTELLGAKRARQFVGDFDEGHAAIIASSFRSLATRNLRIFIDFHFVKRGFEWDHLYYLGADVLDRRRNTEATEPTEAV